VSYILINKTPTYIYSYSKHNYQICMFIAQNNVLCQKTSSNFSGSSTLASYMFCSLDQYNLSIPWCIVLLTDWDLHESGLNNHLIDFFHFLLVGIIISFKSWHVISCHVSKSGNVFFNSQTKSDHSVDSAGVRERIFQGETR